MLWKYLFLLDSEPVLSMTKISLNEGDYEFNNLQQLLNAIRAEIELFPKYFLKI